MLDRKSLLMLPGPTPIPPEVAAAMTMPAINHRGKGFAKMFSEVATGLQQLFRTRQQVYVIPGAGSGGWETALVNFVAPGAKVLIVSIGDFGERWQKAAKALGYQVEKLEFAAGDFAKPAQLAERLAADTTQEIKAVCLQHNETSTGVFNPVAGLAKVIHVHGALAMVDAVSGLGAIPLEMDDWGLDVVLTGAQKALMCPPGLTIVAASEKAWAASATQTGPRFFFDLRPYQASYDKGQTPYTPPVSLYYGLQAALRLIAETGGVEAGWQRHRVLGKMCRAGVKGMGLELLAQDEAFASDAVTAVMVPAGVEAAALRKVAFQEFGVELAPGQGKLTELIFRIGHLGYVTQLDVLSALIAIEQALARAGQPVQLGRAAAAAQAVWLDAGREK